MCMPNEKPQNLQNHTRLVPLFHMFVLPVLMINAVTMIVRLVRFGISFRTVLDLLMGFALLLAALYGRTFAMTVQDRVIRLEMRLRLRKFCHRTCGPAFRNLPLGS